MDEVIPTIFQEMDSDDENDSVGLVDYYNGASTAERSAMNEMCMFLCGWSLETIFKRCGISIDSETGNIT